MIQNLILSIGLSFAIGLNGAKDNHDNFIKNDTPNNVVYDDEHYSIELTLEELDYEYTNLCSLLNEGNLNLSNTTIAYNTHTFIYNNLIVSDNLSYTDQINSYIRILLISSGNDSYKWEFVYDNSVVSFEYNILWTLNSTIYDDIKNAIELDIEANEPATSMGNTIINAIKSGLGLIGDLASQFLLGFSTLFWANSALTPFGTFALVFLGISITMAVVSLVLKLIRGNTGA